MKLIKRLGIFVGAMAIAGASLVATAFADGNPTVYLDYELDANQENITIKLMAKDVPTVYSTGSGSASYAVMGAGAVVDILAGSEDGAITVPMPANDNAAKNKTWLTNNFHMTGYVPIVNFNTGVPNTSDSTRRYLVFQQGGNAADETTWLDVNPDGTVQLATIKLPLTVAGAANTTIAIERANLAVWCKTDEETWEISAGDSQLGYTSLGGANANLNLAPLVLNIGGGNNDPEPYWVDATVNEFSSEVDNSVAVAAKATLSAADAEGESFDTVTWKVTKDEVVKGRRSALKTTVEGEGEVTVGLAIGGINAANLAVQAALGAWGN